MKNGLRRCDILLTSTGNAAGAWRSPFLKTPSCTAHRGIRGSLIIRENTFQDNKHYNNITKTFHA